MDAESTPNEGRPNPQPVRLIRPSVVVLCGPAACGKSTFAERHFRPTQIISSDWARACVCDDDRDQRFNAQAFALVHFLLEQRLTLNRLCVLDSTALTATARQGLLDLAKKFQVPVVALLFDVPLETCVERDQKRERSVGRGVIERQYQIFEQAKAAIRQERFDQVLELQDKDLGQVQIEVIFRPVAHAPQRPQQPEPGTVRRPERPVAPSGPRTGKPGVAGMRVRAALVVRPAQPMPAPRPAAPPAPASPPPPAAVTAPTASPAAEGPAPPSAPAAPSVPPAETAPTDES
ncbi:MAG: ATP-binding protein [Acidobacteriia bacterium]|nr:ATP-binding protein [Terriglobia bacterium]